MECPCTPSKEFKDCCEILISGQREASSAEELMRSRYSAFATQKMQYIEETTDPQTRLNFDMKANEEWAQSARFLKLEILKSSEDGNRAIVEFKATFQIGENEPQIHHEISKFRKQSGVWYFREGRSPKET